MEPVTAVAVPVGQTLQRLTRHLEAFPSAKILEIGCGSVPHLSFALAARGHSVVGVDPSLVRSTVIHQLRPHVSSTETLFIHSSPSPKRSLQPTRTLS
jgi:2-polyprenyl-3-methyl-5-hydroxy-6-metoxy-1,4-benzoquinol methylase